MKLSSATMRQKTFFPLYVFCPFMYCAISRLSEKKFLTTEYTEFHGVLVRKSYLPPCNSVSSVVISYFLDILQYSVVISYFLEYIKVMSDTMRVFNPPPCSSLPSCS